ncbi:MAG: autotransporter-associated beta strand repeat-containing protein, partial [Tepidisphaeraceae bacterium]
MRMTSFKRKAVLSAAVLAALTGAQAQAATLYWDQNGATTTATGGTGNWLGGSTWRDGSLTGTLQAWADGNDAVLPNTNGTVTLNGAISATSLQFGNTTGAYIVSGAGPITVPLIRMVPTNRQTFSGSLSGPLTVQHDGVATAGTDLMLSGVNAFGGGALTIGTGGTSFANNNRVHLNNASALAGASGVTFTGNFGHLSEGAAGIINLPAVTLSSNPAHSAIFSAITGAQLTFASGITGPSNVIIGTGAGAVIFTPGAAYTGTTRIANTYNATTGAPGQLRLLGGDNALPVGGAVIFGQAGSATNAGSLNLNGYEVEIGSLATEPGILANGITNGGSEDPLSTLTINGSATTTYSSTIGVNPTGAAIGTNTIALNLASTNTGSHTFTNGLSSYDQGTTIAGGTLISRNTLNNGTQSPVGTGAVAVSGSGTFGGSGQVIGAVSLSGSTSRLAPGGVAAVDPTNQLNLVGGLTLGDNSNVDFDLFPAGADSITTSTLTIPAFSGTDADDVLLNLNDSAGVGYFNGTYTLIDYTTLVGDFESISPASPTPPPDNPFGGATFTLSNDGANTRILLTIAGAAEKRTWTGASDSGWDVGAVTGATMNWTGPGGEFNNGDSVTFNDTPGSNYTVVVAATGVAPGQMVVDAANNYTFSNASGAVGISGIVSVVKQNSGTLTFNSPNSYSGGTTVTGGVLAVGSAGTLGSGAVSVTNATLALSAAGNIAAVPSVTLATSTLRADASLVTDRPFTLTGATATIDTQGNTLELSGTPSGSAAITKNGAGTLKLSSAGSGLTGAVTVAAGTLAVSAVNATGTSGVGTGGTALTVSSGATFDVQNVRLGIVQATGVVDTGNSLGTLLLKNGSTLSSSGESAIGSPTGIGIRFGNITAADVDITVNTGTAGSRFAARNFLKNETVATTTQTTVHLTGDGMFQIASGSTSNATTGTHYSGDWSVEMGSSGVFSIGPILNGGTAEVITGMGYPVGAAGGETSPISVTSGTLAIGVDARNVRVTTGAFAQLNGNVRSPLTLNGGNIASTGRQYGLDLDASAATPVQARFAANITLTDSTTSKVLLYDPVASHNRTGTLILDTNPVGPRSLEFVTDTLASPAVTSNFTWGNSSTLVVDSGAETGGTLYFRRNSGTVNVGTNATLQINAGSTVELDGTQDALSDG